MELTEDEMTTVVDLHEMREQMANMVARLQTDLVEKLSLRTNIGNAYINMITVRLIRTPLIRQFSVFVKNLGTQNVLHSTNNVKSL